MGYVINNGLRFTIGMSLEISLDEEVGEIVMAAEKGDLVGVREHYLEYQKMNRLVDLGYEMLLDGGLEEWDWQWASDTGHLCEMDWEWFKEDLERAKVSKEEHDKKWKVGRIGKAPDSRSGIL
jgi:hypothetical protein